MNRALLIIDVQRFCWYEINKSSYTPQAEVTTALVARLRQAREAGDVVVFVLLDFTKKRWARHEIQVHMAEHCIGCTHEDLPPYLSHQHEPSFEAIFVKKAGNAFSNPELSKYLHAKGIEEIALVGCWTFDCVLRTAFGALTHGFRVVLLEDAVYPPFGSEDERNRWRDSLADSMRKINKHSNFFLKIE